MARGAKAVAVDINDDAGVALEKDLGDNVVFVNGDVSKPETANKAIELATTKFGKLTGGSTTRTPSGRSRLRIWSRRTGIFPSAPGSRQRRTSCSPRTRT